MNCRFCSSEAVAVWSMDEGCMCHPKDREQALCLHHSMRARPIGSMEMKEDLTGGSFSRWLAKYLTVKG